MSKLIIEAYYKNSETDQRKRHFYLTISCEKEKKKGSPKRSYTFVVLVGDRICLKRKHQKDIIGLIKNSTYIGAVKRLYKFNPNTHFDGKLDITIEDEFIPTILKKLDSYFLYRSGHMNIYHFEKYTSELIKFVKNNV